MKRSFVIKPIPFIIQLVIALGGGTLVGILSQKARVTESLTDPSFLPPPIIFSVVWSILYILMAISVSIIIGKNKQGTEEAVKAYYLQLAANFVWPTLFFTLGLIVPSFIWILLIIALVGTMIFRFYKISKPAAFLQIPYFLWLLFAAAINLAYIVLN